MASNVVAISFGDLRVTAVDAEPRVQDLRLAERLEFTNPRQIRELISRNRPELERYGPVSCHTTMVERRQGGGSRSVEFWLTESQSILICMRSNAPRAADVRAELIEVFRAWRRGELVSAAHLPTITGAINDLFDRKVVPIIQDLRREFKEVAGSISVLAEKGRRWPTADTYRVHGIVIHHHYFDLCPCGECSIKIMDADGFISGEWEYHHQFNRWDNRPEATIPISKPCHLRITTNADARTRFDAMAFPQFQRLLSRLPSRQSSFSF